MDSGSVVVDVVVVGTVAKVDDSWIRGGVAHGDIDTVVGVGVAVVDRVASVSAVAVRAVGVGSRDCSWWIRIRIRVTGMRSLGLHFVGLDWMRSKQARKEEEEDLMVRIDRTQIKSKRVELDRFSSLRSRGSWRLYGQCCTVHVAVVMIIVVVTLSMRPKTMLMMIQIRMEYFQTREFVYEDVS